MSRKKAEWCVIRLNGKVLDTTTQVNYVTRTEASVALAEKRDANDEPKEKYAWVLLPLGPKLDPLLPPGV